MWPVMISLLKWISNPQVREYARSSRLRYTGTSTATVTESLISMKRWSVSCRFLFVGDAGTASEARLVAWFSFLAIGGLMVAGNVDDRWAVFKKRSCGKRALMPSK